ncbi:hypothetical protein BC827DRAFT_1158317 [Russula dissimulans]|nr:hypothetical protein BC827DRAFT_1158317 [Russula dissimulans]
MKTKTRHTHHPPTRHTEAENKADSPPHWQTQHVASSNFVQCPEQLLKRQARDSPDGGTPANTSHKRRVIGDFDDSANALWSPYEREAKSHDEARNQSLKDDMDRQDTKPPADPAQQTVYYLQQNVALLAQISQQLPPMLGSTCIAIGVRDYMHVFQRYSHPLKSARLRQYLCEGVEGWYMLFMAESVPALAHVPLFLFFLGLGDSLLDLNTTVGLTALFLPHSAVFSTFSLFLRQSSIHNHRIKTHSRH